MTLGLFDVGAVVDLAAGSYTGFSYEPHKTELRLIGNGTDAGNVVVQESAKPYRKATLAVVAETDADRDTLRGYDETGETVTLTDDVGATRDVSVLSCATSKIAGGDLWDVQLVLLELSDPVPAGS